MCFLSPCPDKRSLLLRLLAEERLDERLAQSLGEAHLEDDAPQRLLHLAVGRAEELTIARAAVLGVGSEAARAVVDGHHAALLARLAAAADDVLPLLEGTRIDIDAAILGKHCLRLHLEILDKNFLYHCSELIAREVFEKGAYIIADAQLIPSTSTQVKNYLLSFTMSVARTS